MITAVDTNVLLDILIPQAPHGEQSERALIESSPRGAVVLSESVYAELAARFPSHAELDRFLTDTGIRLDPSRAEILYRAGQAWQVYRCRRSAHLVCPRCGEPHNLKCRRCGGSIAARQRIITDFLIGACALVHADRLVTRDRGYYRTYFPQLVLVLGHASFAV